MNSSFPRILTLLRKERGLSQKNAAAELGVSQALLSHYEKGIRECGLDFIVKVSDFYNVSADYLLGLSPNRSGAIISADDLAQGDGNEEPNGNLPSLDKQLIISAVNLIYSVLQEFDNKELDKEITTYIDSAIYIIFRMLYSANKENPQGMFSVPESLYSSYISAVESISLANIKKAVETDTKKQGTEPPLLSHDKIIESYSASSTALFNIISTIEEKLNKISQS